MFRPILALVRKDLTVTWRAPLFAILAVAVPAAFAAIFSMVLQVSTTAPIAVADDDQSATSTAFVQVMRGLETPDGPYYEVRTAEAAEARALFAAGQVGAMVVIPHGFADSVAAAQPVAVELQMNNINADGTKNQQGRLEYAIRTFETQRNMPGALTIHETTILAHDIPFTIYMGSALLVFAALYAGMVNTGTAITREWETRTAKALVLRPDGAAGITWAKLIYSALVSLVTVTVSTWVIAAVIGFPLTTIGWRTIGVLILVWGYGATLGVLLAALLRRSLPLVPIAVILAVVQFLIGGFESYVATYAHGGLIEPFWAATSWFPLSPLFDSARFEIAQLPPLADVTTAAVACVVILAAFLALARWTLTKTLTFDSGQ